MDTDSAQDRRPGGIVEPANRATVAKQRFQAPADPVGERYELRDPFAETIYHLKTIPAIVAKAEQLGATRFQAVDDDGERSQIDKVAGRWQRADGRTLMVPSESVKEAPERASIAAPPVAAPPARGAAAEKLDAKVARDQYLERLEAALNERYVIKRAPAKLGDVAIGQTEYRYRGDTSRVAFTESTFKLATDNNSPSVARSMVDVAEARNWQALRISGNEDFRRMVWLEASLRGVKAMGYEPQRPDIELLRKEREARQVNRIEPAPRETGASAGSAPAKQSARGSGGRKAVLAALEAVLVAQRVPTKQRDAVMAAAAENLAQRLREGQTLKVKVFDKSAPSQRPVVVLSPEVQRTRERAAPTR